ncbi:hypothetical protein [Hymenobacter volaticus]|uniref:hypothetical protein n=1 Tax=Hymenobacter volaticus TaxID=2932254 RepID=UPI001FD71C0F|nr:hypothetical protein [Hymenobacter volaticus]
MGWVEKKFRLGSAKKVEGAKVDGLGGKLLATAEVDRKTRLMTDQIAVLPVYAHRRPDMLSPRVVTLRNSSQKLCFQLLLKLC